METSTIIGYICSGLTGIFIGFFMALYYVKTKSKKEYITPKKKETEPDYEMIPYRD